MIHIRAALPTDNDALVALWERSVRATHHFLHEKDIAFYRPMVREFLTMDMDFWVACEEKSVPLGFAGVDIFCIPAKLEALFVEPDRFRQGIGERLVRHALSQNSNLVLDVNEQNPGALSFYTRLGFRQTGRSALDGAGKPYPLIHMAAAE